ncbi:MAG: sulfatase [Flavobacteriaceae bacterium]
MRYYILILISIVFLTGCTKKQSVERPNILWLTSEDNNIDWVGCYGNEYAETPNIDALAEQGFRYTHCYANAPVCAPSRSTWITGVNAISMGTHPMRSRNDIPHDIIKYYPDYLKEVGYYVSNGMKSDYNIGGRPDNDCWDMTDKKVSNEEVSSVDWKTLGNQQPFFKIINFFESHESRAQGDVNNTIHNPNNVNLRGYHPDIPDVRKTYAKYHDAVKRMDTGVGEALKKLEELGLADNTIVIYNSDHGGVLPRSKRYLFASGIHSPLIIRIPEKYKSLYPAKEVGTIVDRLVSFVDMPKTWLSITGAPVPNYMQGNIFLGKNTEPEQEYHFAYRGRMDEGNENARAVYDKEFVYIRNYMPYAPWVQHLQFLWKMRATEAWEKHVNDGKATKEQAKYFYPKTYTEEFYSLKDDWDNTNNLIENDKYAEKIAAMREALHDWQLKIYDAALLPEAEMIKRAKENDVTIYEMVRNPKLYDLPTLLDAADVALEQNEKNIGKLRNMLDNEDSGVRYWAMVGSFLLNDEVAGLKAINDDSHEVRILAAWTLIKNGKREYGFTCLNNMLKENSYATLKILNVVEWMGEDRENMMNTIKKMDLSGEKNKYELRQKEYLENRYK